MGLVDYLKKKSIRMHGNMNVKFTTILEHRFVLG